MRIEFHDAPTIECEIEPFAERKFRTPCGGKADREGASGVDSPFSHFPAPLAIRKGEVLRNQYSFALSCPCPICVANDRTDADGYTATYLCTGKDCDIKGLLPNLERILSPTDFDGRSELHIIYIAT